MKPRCLYLVVWMTFIACCGGLAAGTTTNLVEWQRPTNGLAAARWQVAWKYPSAITTNTPAFEAWAVEFMLAKANETREKWELEIPKPLTLDDVYFIAAPTAHGLRGTLITRDGRFVWHFSRNALLDFYDTNYYSVSFRYKDEAAARLAKIPSKITKKDAERIARDGLVKLLGMTEEQLGYRKRVEVNQYKFQESDGKVYPLPLFEVTWRLRGPKRYAAENIEYTPLDMQVSGITGKIVKYSHSKVLDLNSPIRRDPLPTNYFQMLGLPDNYLDTVPESKRRFWGLPPRTNALDGVP